jgi:putative NIF3 family GTP cyclohydrolase 1 type 2
VTTVRDVIAAVERMAGHPLNRDEGLHHGRLDTAVERILACWMATPQALARAAELGAQLVIAHESLYYPYDAAVRSDNPPGWEAWPTNAQRRALLERHGLSLLRVHGSADEICIYDDFARRLGLGEAVAGEGLARVFAIAPCALGELVARVKAATGMAAVRVVAPRGLGQQVSRVGLPWGGMALFVNVGYLQRLVALGCDVLIAGESDNYGMRFGAELGIAMIETSHEVSENGGLQVFAERLAAELSLPVSCYPNPPIWRMV